MEFVHQDRPQGTGHAVQCCREHLNVDNTKVLILSGDVPLIKQNTLEKMVVDMKVARIMTTEMEEPSGYGRVIEKDGMFDKIVEEKDCMMNSDDVKKSMRVYIVLMPMLCINIYHFYKTKMRKRNII